MQKPEDQLTVKYTNKFELPLPVVMAVKANTYDKHGDFSMTQLNNPPQMEELKRRHAAELSTDVSTQAYSLESTALHALLAEAKVPGGQAEMRFLCDVDGKKVSMKPDFLYPLPDGTYHLIDNKRVSWMAVKEGPKEDWVAQLNGYAYGLRKMGYKISKISVICWYRDWSYMECHIKKLANYPPCEIQELMVPIWPDDKCHQYLSGRLVEHLQARMLPDEKLPECSNEDRWADPDCFAVVQTEGKNKGKAVPGGARFVTLAEAQQFLGSRSSSSAPATIEYRRSESKRCERGYCEAAPFCHQYNKKIAERDPF